MKTAEDYFKKYAEMDSNVLADRSKLMSIEEFRQAFGWRDKEIKDLIDEMIKEKQNYLSRTIPEKPGSEFLEMNQPTVVGGLQSLTELKAKL